MHQLVLSLPEQLTSTAKVFNQSQRVWEMSHLRRSPIPSWELEYCKLDEVEEIRDKFSSFLKEKKTSCDFHSVAQHQKRSAF